MAFCRLGTDERLVGNFWSHDRLERSIRRVLEGEDGEDTHLSATSGTLMLMLSVRPGDTSTVWNFSALRWPLNMSSLCLRHSSSRCRTSRISRSTNDWLLRERSLKNGLDVKVLSCVSRLEGAELRQNSDALRMIRLEVSTTTTLAVLLGQSERLLVAEEMRRVRDAGLVSGSRIMTLLAVSSW